MRCSDSVSHAFSKIFEGRLKAKLYHGEIPDSIDDYKKVISDHKEYEIGSNDNASLDGTQIDITKTKYISDGIWLFYYTEENNNFALRLGYDIQLSFGLNMLTDGAILNIPGMALTQSI